MKKRIFIAMHYMEIGGAEISLIGLLQALDYSKYDVDLFIYSHQGELMQFIPKEVRLLPEISAYACIERPIKEALKRGQIGIVIGRLMAKWQFDLYAKRKKPGDITAVFQYVMNYVTPFLPSLKKMGVYDVAISYLTPHNIVAKKVNALKKIAWIHTDYSTIDVNEELEQPIWDSYDKIVSISEETAKAFVSCFPSLKEKVIMIENILSPVFVKQRAELISKEEISNDISRGQDNVIMLSVGRIVYQKNYDNVPTICRMIIELGLKVKWYIIGFGIDEQLVRKKIEEEGMQKHVILLGKRSNPYPYIKACDIYVQPSRYEGKSVTVREAQMLGKPVVVTDYNTARSQIENGVDGVIVPRDNEGCAKGIAFFIRDKELRTKIMKNLMARDYGNEKEINRLYKIIESV